LVSKDRLDQLGHVVTLAAQDRQVCQVLLDHLVLPETLDRRAKLVQWVRLDLLGPPEILEILVTLVQLVVLVLLDSRDLRVIEVKLDLLEILEYRDQQASQVQQVWLDQGVTPAFLGQLGHRDQVARMDHLVHKVRRVPLDQQECLVLQDRLVQ
jgi:hypothetical protein